MVEFGATVVPTGFGFDSTRVSVQVHTIQLGFGSGLVSGLGSVQTWFNLVQQNNFGSVFTFGSTWLKLVNNGQTINTGQTRSTDGSTIHLRLGRIPCSIPPNLIRSSTLR
ncbi:hypothetical protein Hanom_Chr08g00739611 [Helianthus anomalus]